MFRVSQQSKPLEIRFFVLSIVFMKTKEAYKFSLTIPLWISP